MYSPRFLGACLALACLGLDVSAQGVCGWWFTEPEAALAEARKLGRPALAANGKNLVWLPEPKRFAADPAAAAAWRKRLAGLLKDK